MLKHSLKSVFIFTLLICFTFSPKPSEAAWQLLAWNVFKELAIDTAIDVVQDFFKEDVSPEKVAELNKRVAKLETQLHEYDGKSQSIADFKTVKQMIAGLNSMVNTMTKRLSAVEDRVDKLESELAQLRQALLNISQVDKGLSRDAALDFQINYVYRSGGKGNYKTISNGSVLHSGDYYKIIFTPVEDAYVYIFQVDSANKLYRLFPMAGFSGVTVNNFNPVKAGKTYYIPAKYKSFELDDVTGTETIYFVASRTKDIVLEQQYTLNDIAQSQLAQIQLIETLRKNKGMKAIKDDVAGDNITWQEQGQTFSVLQRNLEDLCNGCVNILTFEHQ